jgi:hypothetical protein
MPIVKIDSFAAAVGPAPGSRANSRHLQKFVAWAPSIERRQTRASKTHG